MKASKEDFPKVDADDAPDVASGNPKNQKGSKNKENKRVGPWKRGKGGRLLPVLTLEKKNGRGVCTNMIVVSHSATLRYQKDSRESICGDRLLFMIQPK